MESLHMNTWLNISEGCPMRFSVSGSDVAHLMVGDNQIELGFDAEALRTLVTLSTAALAEVDDLYAAELLAEDAHP